MPRPKNKAPNVKDAPRAKTRLEMEKLMENYSVPCPGCGGEVPRRLLIRYEGRSLCSGCFVGACHRARGEARRTLVPFYMRARRYADMANSWRMVRSAGCGCKRGFTR